MLESTLRWTIYLAAAFVFGPIAGTLTGSLHATDGSHSATPLVCASPSSGLLMGLAAMGIALVVGLVAARLLGAAPGMTAAGIVVAWAAWRTGDVDELIRTAQSGRPLTILAAEGAIFGCLAVAMCLAIVIVAPDGKAVAPPTLRDRFWGGPTTPVAVLIALFAAGVAAWFVGVTPLKGQAVFAAIAAGTLAAAAGRLADFRLPLASLSIPIAALAVVGPLAGMAIAGSQAVVQMSYKGTLFPLANIAPLDWVAGGLLGIPQGVSWAGSMIEKKS
jgi:hypothetical protein